MKIIFLCGSIEPGRDGVGDYTRRLASELIRQGHNVIIISLNDRFIFEVSDALQIDGIISISVLRIPGIVKTNEKILLVKKWLNDFNPDWISLQYVPFSFQAKGLHFGLVNLLSKIGHGRKWHIMFHELWVGIEAQSSYKHILWGKLQKILIKNLIKRLNPCAIHTQTHIYQKILLDIGISCKFLELFGNIPKLPLDKKSFNSVCSGSSISMVIFGSIHSVGAVESFAKQAAEYSLKNGVKVSLTLIGRTGPESERWLNAWKSLKLPVKIFAEKTPEFISKTLQESDYGITTNPLALIQKSGTVSSMIEHGLKIICVSEKWKYKHLYLPESPYCITEYNKRNFELCLKEKKNCKEKAGISAITKQFLQDINY